jgi:hypothetical protein
MNIFHYNTDFSLIMNIVANGLVVVGIMFATMWVCGMVSQIVKFMRSVQ